MTEIINYELADKLYKAFVKAGEKKLVYLYDYSDLDKIFRGRSKKERLVVSVISHDFSTLKFTSYSYTLDVWGSDLKGVCSYSVYSPNMTKTGLKKFQERLLKFISEVLPKLTKAELQRGC